MRPDTMVIRATPRSVELGRKLSKLRSRPIYALVEALLEREVKRVERRRSGDV